MYERGFSMKRRIAFTFCVAGVLVFMSVVQAQDPRGTPGVDYPNYFTVPDTSFKCSDQKFSPGFYADLETKCQVFHFCYQDRQESFLCPTGTIFNQAVLTCDVWYKSNCSLAPMFYSVNAGPIMERAGKNLPMLLRLRNRSQKNPSIKTSTGSVFDKVSSLRETPETSSTYKNSELKAITSEKSTESYLSDFDNKNERMSYGHELDSDKDDASEETGNELSESDETEDVDTNLVYDHVNDGYYRSYGQQEEWQDTEPVSEEFGDFYDYRDPENEYGAHVRESSMNDYDNEYFEDSGYPQFTQRSYRPEHSRVRRKPVYVVLDDQPAADTETADSLEFDTSAKSESREGKQVNLTEPEEEVTPRPEPFPRPTPIPHHLLNISSETPMTSEEFESAIWKDLILPYIPDDQEGPILNVPSDDEETSTRSEETENQSDMQSDDETIYIENDLEPDRYVPYVSQYEDAVVIPEMSDEAYVQSYTESQQDDTDSEDTFVVIPDEYDGNVVDSVSNEDFELQNYPEETVYRTQMLADRSPVEGYGTYEDAYEYSSNMGYPQHYQDTYYNPEMAAGMYQNEMPRDQRYGYESDYELPRQSEMNYESSNFETENIYTHSDYPYAEAKLPVEADLGSLSNEDFVYVLDDQPEVETFENTRTADYLEDSLVERETREGKQMNITSEPEEEVTPRPEPFPRPTPIPHHLLNISSETPMTSEEFESAIWKDLILPYIPDDQEGPILNVPSDDEDTSAQSTSESDTQSDDETIYIENDLQETDSDQNFIQNPGQEPGQSEDVYYVFDDFDEQSSEGQETRSSEDENETLEESSSKISDKVEEETHETQPINSTNEESSSSNVSLDNENERREPTETDYSSFSQDSRSKDKRISYPDVKTANPKSTLSGSNLGHSKQTPLVHETLTSLNAPFSTNMDNFDFSTDARFLSNMGYSESMDFGPYGFGPNMGQFSMDSMQQSRASNPFSQRMGQTEQPKLSPLSAIQEKMRSMKQGKFGAFKKYMSSTRK